MASTESQPKKFSWKKAGDHLTDTEKNRLCCLLLTCLDQVKPTSDHFRAAAAEFGAAQGGFTKMYQTTIKKLKENNCYVNEDDAPPATPKNTPSATETVTPGSKRKNNKASDEGQSPKKRGRPKKSTSAPTTEFKVEESTTILKDEQEVDAATEA